MINDQSIQYLQGVDTANELLNHPPRTSMDQTVAHWEAIGALTGDPATADYAAGVVHTLRERQQDWAS